MATTYNPRIVTNGLVMYLDAANPQSYPGSGTTWTDLSRNGNNGTLTNGPTFSSANKGSIVFDSVDDHALVASSASIPTGAAARTVSVWFYTTATSWVVNTNTLFHYGAGSTGASFGIDMDVFPKMEFFSWGGTGRDLIFNTGFSEVGWKNICVTYDGITTVLIYENGVNTQTLTLSSACNTSATNLYIGAANPSAISSYFDGKISNAQLYNRALSAAEIKQNYYALMPRFPSFNIVTDGLVLHLDAGNTQSYSGSGTTWTDLSGNGNDMTIAGSPTYSTLEGFTFDGTVGKYIIRNPITIPTTTLSAEIWVKTTDSGSGIISYNSTGVDNAWLLFNPANLDLYVNPNNGATGVNIATGTWKQVVRTSNRSTGQEIIYVNGVVASTSTISAGTNLVSGGSLVLGQEQDSVGGGFEVSQAFNGNIASFKLYNKVLSAAEVAQNFNAIRERFGV